MKRVLVGFDGSSGAGDAVALARNLAPGATVVLAFVLPHEDPLAHHYQLLPADSPAVREDFFDDAIASLEGIEVEPRCYVGASPAHVLRGLVEEEELDLVVLGAPHRGTLGRALIGSVAEAVLHDATTPVALAPHGYAAGGH